MTTPAPGQLVHDDGTVCHHGRDIAVDFGDPAITAPATVHTTGGGVGYPCANGQMITGISGLHLDAAEATEPKRGRRRKTDLPKIKLLSWPGLESIGWAIIIGHLIKWAVSTWYFIVTQAGWGFAYPPGKWHSYWALKNPWDHAPAYLGRFLDLFGWHVRYLFLASTDHGWTEPRHLARGVMIGLVAGVFLGILFGKPKHPADVHAGPVRYILTLPMALIWAVPGIAAVALLAWQLPWLTRHGLALPAGDPFASEVNGWLAAGAWIGAVMGLAGSQLFAKYATTKPADDAGWFFAERSAAKIRSTTGLAAYRHRIYGTPTHRVRVRYLLDHGTTETVSRSPWVVRILLAAAFITLLMAGIGAWLTIAGPAAGA